MKFGFLALMTAVFVLATPQVSLAQEVDAAADDSAAATVEGAADAAVYTPMAPTDGKGMPVDRGLTFQDQYTADGAYALWMHDWILLPVITAISLFVLALLLWVIVRYNRRANPIPSKNTHNTAIEVIWTVIPALILVVIAVPSITLLARQYETPPADAITIKAVGYQWYWGYEYPDHDIELVSNMLDENEALTSGEPHQLAVDNRMVVPVGVPLRIQTTAADVIHAFAVPSLWFKQDAVPGRLNERMLVIDEPGVYYGQCSELCGSLHGFMPIAVEAVPMEDFEKWVASKGGTMPGAEAASEAAPATEGEAEAAPAA
ncbi:MAG: cytochrome c oxidase subunit II [Erythrobacter sp.]|uniref:cytochrome c oxidase subunit II n=1 Tax=Erythrobacter sp. TaxID=1042 RepID=UPI003A8A53C2